MAATTHQQLSPAREPPEAERWQRVAQPPRWGFHAMLGIVALAALWSASYPGGTILGVVAVPALGALVVLWLLRVGIFLGVRRSADGLASPRWLVVAPLAGMAVLGMLVVQLPLQARFALSRSAFDAVVDRAQPDVAPNVTAEVEVGDRAGWYATGRAFQQGDATIVYINGASFIDEGGFAHLPSGPFPGLGTAGGMEHPVFTHLTGDWYTWTAGW